MRKRTIQVIMLMAMLITAVMPVSGYCAAPAYPGEAIDGNWLSINGKKSFDVKAGKSTSINMEGVKEETAIAIISDDGESVKYSEDGFEYTATKNPDGSLTLIMKGREKFPINYERVK